MFCLENSPNGLSESSLAHDSLLETGPLTSDSGKASERAHPLLDRPILPTLTALALPNILALSVQSLAAIAETSYIGRIGTEALAAARSGEFSALAWLVLLAMAAYGGSTALFVWLSRWGKTAAP